jgi:hypothetical protein
MRNVAIPRRDLVIWTSVFSSLLIFFKNPKSHISMSSKNYGVKYVDRYIYRRSVCKKVLLPPIGNKRW